jgi:hypothetical protein
MTPVGLECALGHETWLLLIPSRRLRQAESINDAAQTGQTTLARSGSERRQIFSGAALFSRDALARAVVLFAASAQKPPQPEPRASSGFQAIRDILEERRGLRKTGLHTPRGSYNFDT